MTFRVTRAYVKDCDEFRITRSSVRDCDEFRVTRACVKDCDEFQITRSSVRDCDEFRVTRSPGRAAAPFDDCPASGYTFPFMVVRIQADTSSARVYTRVRQTASRSAADTSDCHVRGVAVSLVTYSSLLCVCW
ncbi:hypothetical protein LSAT2_031251 [Lamellibrachia satsuma]|nr:hypothetical protein LSAT2_031251 [Lamellibrachia satsuma]